jgi:hypothetical protein
VPLRGTHWVRGAIADTQVWRNNPYAGIAVACGASGLVVLDGDTRHGARLDDAAQAFGSEILQTVRQRSGGGGWHLFFQAPVGCDIRNLFLATPPGWELIGRGFGVVLYPSIHPSGQRYAWEIPPWAARVLPMPDLLLRAASAALNEKRQGGANTHDQKFAPLEPAATGDMEPGAAVDYAAQLVAKASQGRRNTTLFAAARYLGSLVAVGQLDPDAARAGLTAAAGGVGLGERETQQTISSGFKIGAKYPYEEGVKL